MTSVELTGKNLQRYDLILLSTDHTFYKENSKLIIQNSKLILDTRNAFGEIEIKDGKIFKA